MSVSFAIMAQKTVQKISDKVTVTFPAKPEQQTPMGDNGPRMFTLTKDSSSMYMAMALDLTPMGLSVETIESMGDGLWDMLTGNMTQQMGGAEIVKSEKTQIKGKTGRYLEIDGAKSTAPNLKGKRAFCYLFFVGSNLHQFAYYTDKKDATVNDAKDFFDSIAIDGGTTSTSN